MSTIKVAHLSDSHLLANSESTLYEINPANHLTKVISVIKKRQYDLIIFTGDIAENGNEKSYQSLLKMLDDLNTPCIIIPGNHDDENTLLRVISTKENQWVSPQFPIGFRNWHFVYINTNVANQAYGKITDKAVSTIKNTITQLSGSICIIMHHPLFPIDVEKLDQYKIINPEELLSVLTNKIKLVICGHIHGDYRWFHDGISFESAPSTGFQFEAMHQTSKIDYSINNKMFGFKEYIFGNSVYQSTTIWCHEKII